MMVFDDLIAQVDIVHSEGERKKPARNAFVFVTAEPESVKSAFEDLKRIEGVSEVYHSKGAYDFVVKVSGDSLDHLREVVFKRIKNLSSINSTLTLTVI